MYLALVSTWATAAGARRCEATVLTALPQADASRGRPRRAPEVDTPFKTADRSLPHSREARSSRPIGPRSQLTLPLVQWRVPVLGGATRWASEAVVRVGGHRGVLLQRQETQLEQHSPRNHRQERDGQDVQRQKNGKTETDTPPAETETETTDEQKLKLQTRCSQTSGPDG